MADRNRRGINWTLPAAGTITLDQAQLAVLMDIREELQRLNRLLHCHNFIGMPATLRSISRKLAKPRRKRTLRRVA